MLARAGGGQAFVPQSPAPKCGRQPAVSSRQSAVARRKKTIHNPPLPIRIHDCSSLCSSTCRLLTPYSCTVSHTTLAYEFRFVKGHEGGFGPAREAHAPAPGVIPVPPTFRRCSRSRQGPMARPLMGWLGFQAAGAGLRHPPLNVMVRNRAVQSVTAGGAGWRGSAPPC
jgi:hypothetical protein